MVSTQAGDTTTAFTITTADSVYIDWAFINQGSVAINNAFGVELLLDGTQVHTWPAGVPLNPNFYTYINDYSLGQLAAGNHTVTVVADYLNQVTEGNENNNTATYTFTVARAGVPGPGAYRPSGMERAARGVHSSGQYHDHFLHHYCQQYLHRLGLHQPGQRYDHYHSPHRIAR